MSLDILMGGPLTDGFDESRAQFGSALAGGHRTNQIVCSIGPLWSDSLAGFVYARFLANKSK